MEIIEYLEELVDLAKLLVGVNAFRSGLLERPKFQEYARKIRERESDRNAAQAEAEQQNAQIAKNKLGHGFIRRRRGFSLGKLPSHNDAITGKTTGLAVPEVNMLRRTSTALWGGDGAADSNEEAVEDLPMSLQRVMTKRMENRQRERRASRASRASKTRRNTDDPKGKRPLRPAATWAV